MLQIETEMEKTITLITRINQKERILNNQIILWLILPKIILISLLIISNLIGQMKEFQNRKSKDLNLKKENQEMDLIQILNNSNNNKNLHI